MTKKENQLLNDTINTYKVLMLDYKKIIKTRIGNYYYNIYNAKYESLLRFKKECNIVKE